MSAPQLDARPLLTTPNKSGLAWGLCFACFVLPWLNPFAGGPSPSVQPWLISAACTAVAFALQPPGRLNTAFLLCIAALVGWAIARTGLSGETLALAGAGLMILMAAVCAAGGIPRKEFLDAVALAWLAAAAVSTAIGLLQYFGAADAMTPWISASTIGEAFANLRQRNQFASLCVIGMASLLWLLPRALSPWHAAAAMGWLAIGNAATTSRTGLLQMLVLGVLIGLWPGARRQRVAVWSAGVLAYSVAAFMLPWLLEAVTGLAGNRLWERVAAGDACTSRTVLWSNVLQLIAHRPWQGWGWGELDYAHYLTMYPGLRFCDILDNAHNLPLHLAVELGVPAAMLVCGGALWACARARPWREADPRRQMAWAVLAVITIHSLLEYPLWYGPFQLALGLCVGLLWPALPRFRGEIPAGLASSGLPAALAAAVAVACVYATWDYRRVSQIYLPPEARSPAYRDDPLPLIRQSWLFRSQAAFAELTITPLTQANAEWALRSARALLHYSPEPRVIETLIESATLLGRQDEAVLELARYRAAFPDSYEKWLQKSGIAGRAPGRQPAR